MTTRAYVVSAPMLETRAFFKGRHFGREKLVVVVGRPRSVRIERGTLRGTHRTKVTRPFSSSSDSRLAFQKECDARLADGWTEIRALIEEQYFEPPIGCMLDPSLKQALIDTARAAPNGKPKKTAAKTKVAPPVSRSDVLTDLVTRGKRVRVDGQLVLPTGRIVAADPMLLGEAPPFERAVPPGRYPVVLSMKNGLVAAATIVTARGVPDRWEIALPKGMKRLVSPRLRRPNISPSYGYPVDSATGAFLDASVVGEIEDNERLIDRLIGTRARNRCHKAGRGAATIAVFQSGAGDGTYGTYFGLRGDELVCVTTDFLL